MFVCQKKHLFIIYIVTLQYKARVETLQQFRYSTTDGDSSEIKTTLAVSVRGGEISVTVLCNQVCMCVLEHCL